MSKKPTSTENTGPTELKDSDLSKASGGWSWSVTQPTVVNKPNDGDSVAGPQGLVDKSAEK